MTADERSPSVDLFQAICDGDMAAMEKAIENGANLLSPLGSAAEEIDAETPWQPKKDSTPLLYASRMGHGAMTRALLRMPGVAVPEQSAPALIEALEWTHGGECALILAQEGGPGVATGRDKRWGQTPLAMAAARGQAAVVRALLPLCDPTDRAKDGMTALMMAGSSGECVKILLAVASQEDVSAQDCHGRTVLMSAALSGSAEAIRALLDDGRSNPDTRDKEGNTALLHALDCPREPGEKSARLLAAEPGGAEQVERWAIEKINQTSTKEIETMAMLRMEAMAEWIPLDVARVCVERLGAKNAPALRAKLEAHAIGAVVFNAEKTPEEDKDEKPQQQAPRRL